MIQIQGTSDDSLVVLKAVTFPSLHLETSCGSMCRQSEYVSV